MENEPADPVAAPIKPEEEWANALSHGVAAVMAIVLGTMLVRHAFELQTLGEGLPRMPWACGAYALTVIGTFAASTLSHAIFKQPWLNTFRAWDQAMIYLMITGTYTPIVAAFAPDSTRNWLMVAIWIAAISGFATKVIARHRINSIGTVSYLLLGWLPAIPLVGQVPSGLAWGMLIGGVLYSIGVVFLRMDEKAKYLHVVWHAFVMAAAYTHYFAISKYCLASTIE